MKKLNMLAQVTAARRLSGLDQSAFWSRFGITQSGGSRLETGRKLPKPVKILMWLYDNGKISNQDLEDARKALEKELTAPLGRGSCHSTQS